MPGAAPWRLVVAQICSSPVNPCDSQRVNEVVRLASPPETEIVRRSGGPAHEAFEVYLFSRSLFCRCGSCAGVRDVDGGGGGLDRPGLAARGHAAASAAGCRVARSGGRAGCAALGRHPAGTESCSSGRVYRGSVRQAVTAVSSFPAARPVRSHVRPDAVAGRSRAGRASLAGPCARAGHREPAGHPGDRIRGCGGARVRHVAGPLPAAWRPRRVHELHGAPAACRRSAVRAGRDRPEQRLPAAEPCRSPGTAGGPAPRSSIENGPSTVGCRPSPVRGSQQRRSGDREQHSRSARVVLRDVPAVRCGRSRPGRTRGPRRVRAKLRGRHRRVSVVLRAQHLGQLHPSRRRGWQWERDR